MKIQPGRGEDFKLKGICKESKGFCPGPCQEQTGLQAIATTAWMPANLDLGLLQIHLVKMFSSTLSFEMPSWKLSRRSQVRRAHHDQIGY